MLVSEAIEQLKALDIELLETNAKSQHLHDRRQSLAKQIFRAIAQRGQSGSAAVRFTFGGVLYECTSDGAMRALTEDVPLVDDTFELD